MKSKLPILLAAGALALATLPACGPEPAVEAEASPRWVVECYVGDTVVYSQKFADVRIGDTGIFVPNSVGEYRRLDGTCRAIVLGR